MDNIRKTIHFVPVRTNFLTEDYARMYLQEIVKLHGVPISIISDRDKEFLSHFWKLFQKGLGTMLSLSTTFHQQSDGKAERTIQTLKDMPWACMIDYGGS